MDYSITFGYKKNKLLYEDFSINIPDGKISVICGHNGAGKTTLLKIISGILPSNLENNHAWFVSATGGLIKHFTLEEHLQIINASNNPDLEEALNLFDAKKFYKEPIRNLSTGQVMMASIITACASSSQIILLDEPFSSLDPVNSENLVTILKKLNKTVLLSSHDLFLTTEVADKIMFIKNGKITWSTTTYVDVEELKEKYKEFA